MKAYRDKALEYSLKIVDEGLKTLSHAYPDAASVDNIYPATPNDGWTNGFWTGMLWLAYELTGDEKYKEEALWDVDDFLDHINGAAKSILLYCPVRFDAQLKDLAQYIYAETDAMKKMFALFDDIKRNYTQIVLQCDRITELEHAADDSYEEYIEYIFRNEENAVELIKYKNIAEALEGATDSAKRVSDSVRKIILRYTE